MGKPISTALAVILIFHTATQAAQHPPLAFEWVKVGSGSGQATKLRLDASGNAVISGFLHTNMTFDPFAFTNTLDSSVNTYWYGFNLAVDMNGSPFSGIQTSGNGSVQMFATPLKNGGFAYFGSLQGIFKLGSNSRTNPATGGGNTFYAFTDGAGALTGFGIAAGDTFNSDTVADATITPEGDVVSYGVFTSSTIEFGLTTLTNEIPQNGSQLMLAMFSSVGAPLWARSYPAQGSELASSVAVDAIGNLYIAGSFAGPADQTFQFGNTSLTNGVGYSAFVAKLTATGDPVWVRSFNVDSNNFASGLTINDAGEIFSVVNCGPSWPAQMWLTKYDQEGRVLSQYSSPKNAITYGTSVALGYDGDAYVGGNRDGYGAIWKIDDHGDLVWLKMIAGSPNQNLNGLIMTQTGQILVLGWAGGTNIEADGTLIEIRGGSASKFAPFLAKLPPDPPLLRFTRSDDGLVLSWPTNQPAFQLEANDLSLLPENWQAVPFGTADSRFAATNSISGSGQVFRLRKAN